MQLQQHHICPGSSIYMLEEFVAAGSVRQAFPSDTEKISGELVYKVAQLDDLLEGNITAINIAS
jgi:predicted RNA-binding protein with PUA domain